MKRFIAYLLYTVGLLIIIYYGSIYYEQVRSSVGRDFDPAPLWIFNSVYSIIVGMYIALPKLVNSLREPGSIQVNWLKILIIAIPMLVISASGVLLYNVKISALVNMFFWIYTKFNMTGLVLIGVVGGYTLLSSISKEQRTYTTLKSKNSIAKVITIVILATFSIYIAASGIIHPIKLIEVNAEIVDHEDRSGYQVNEGTETVYFKQTEIRYTIVFKNMSNTRLKDIRDNNKIWIEPSENLERLFEEGFFEKRDSFGSSSDGSNAEIYINYTIGSIDPAGNHPNKYPPSQEELDKIKNSLYDAVLVFEIKDNKVKRYDLMDYKKD